MADQRKRTLFAGGFAAALALSLVTALCLSCAGAKVKGPDEEASYKEALESLEGHWYSRDYQRAIEDFQKLMDQFPFSKYAILAELRIADAYFKKEDFLTSIEHYKEFKKKHPKNENVPYATFRIGLAYEELSLSYDRDQVSTENASVTYTDLITSFPDSQYVAEAEKRRRECNETLANNIMYIGRLYFRRSNYQSAAGRFEELLQKFPDSGLAEEALYYLARSLEESNQSEAAAEAHMKMLKRFPSGRYSKGAAEYIQRRTVR
jgi:outer membrane protein assembly factor BamD